MKTIVSMIILMLAIACISPVSAQQTAAIAKPKWKTVVIKTSAECESCKERIEKALLSASNIRFANLSLGSKKVTVKYDSRHLTPDAVRDIIVSVGYQADGHAANPAAYEALPACCKVGGHE